MSSLINWSSTVTLRTVATPPTSPLPHARSRDLPTSDSRWGWERRRSYFDPTRLASSASVTTAPITPSSIFSGDIWADDLTELDKRWGGVEDLSPRPFTIDDFHALMAASGMQGGGDH